MYCYVVKWPVFRLQRGSAKSPIAPSNFNPLWTSLPSTPCPKLPVYLLQVSKKFILIPTKAKFKGINKTHHSDSCSLCH